MLANFNPADGDKIKLFDTDGVTLLQIRFQASNVALTIHGFGNAVYVRIDLMRFFNLTDTDLANVTISNYDFTVARKKVFFFRAF